MTPSYIYSEYVFTLKICQQPSEKGSFVDEFIINSSSLFHNSGGFMSSHIRSAANFVY